MKIALVHDFLREYGGGERVLEALHKVFPESPVFVAFVDKKSLGPHWQRFSDWTIYQTWFAKIPFHKSVYSPLRFLAAKAFQSIDLSDFDLVITSTNAFQAKAVKVPRGKQLCYCHTPPRSLYGYSTMSSWRKNLITRFFGQIINHYMRVIDFQTAQRVDQFVANSEETQKRIAKFYRRDAIIVYPPVQLAVPVEKLKKFRSTAPQDYYFYVNRLGLQKHPEIALEACLKLGKKIKIAGEGPMLSRLKELAAGSDLVEFMGSVDDRQLAYLYAGAKALLYPVEDEDFGMVPIEAMMAGVPVIAHNSGGPSYTVKTGVNGLLFNKLVTEGLENAMREFEKMKFDSNKIRSSVDLYTYEKFKERMQLAVQNLAEKLHTTEL